MTALLLTRRITAREWHRSMRPNHVSVRLADGAAHVFCDERDESAYFIGHDEAAHLNNERRGQHA